jgi:hypothetical protein
MRCGLLAVSSPSMAAERAQCAPFTGRRVDWARWLWQSDNADINVLRHALSNDLHVLAACSGPSSML